MKGKKRKIILTSIALVILLIGWFIYNYLTTFSPADIDAINSLLSTDDVKVEETKDLITFTPKNNEATTGIIYYPGGKVAPQSFAYAANKLASNGYLVVIQKMPFNLAIFGKDKAQDIVQKYNNIDNWYLSGFSLGGTAACMTLSKDSTQFKGLILYASYTNKNYNLSSVINLSVLSISGSNDGLSTPEKINNGKQFLPSNTIYYEIEGANHTQFALYGGDKIQNGDNKSNISKIEQQDIIIEKTLEFIKNN